MVLRLISLHRFKTWLCSPKFACRVDRSEPEFFCFHQFSQRRICHGDWCRLTYSIHRFLGLERIFGLLLASRAIDMPTFLHSLFQGSFHDYIVLPGILFFFFWKVKTPPEFLQPEKGVQPFAILRCCFRRSTYVLLRFSWNTEISGRRHSRRIMVNWKYWSRGEDHRRSWDSRRGRTSMEVCTTDHRPPDRRKGENFLFSLSSGAAAVSSRVPYGKWEHRDTCSASPARYCLGLVADTEARAPRMDPLGVLAFRYCLGLIADMLNLCNYCHERCN